MAKSGGHLPARSKKKAASPRDPEILHGFFCESVRDEVGGRTTAIGIWGVRCRIQANPPASIPLAFHCYIWNPDRVPLIANLRFHFPGATDPIPVMMPLTMTERSIAHNVNLNMLGVVPITGPGDLVADVILTNERNIVRATARFQMEFVFDGPPDAAPLAAIPSAAPPKSSRGKRKRRP
jgi:hypothetical protein